MAISVVIQEKTESSNFNSKRMKSFYAWDGDILVLNVLGTPSAKRDIIGKPIGAPSYLMKHLGLLSPNIHSHTERIG